MVPKGFLDRGIFPETFPFVIVVVICLRPFPVMAFDTEMVFRLYGKGRFAVAGFEHSLGKGDACRNPGPFPFPHGNACIVPDILVLRAVAGKCLRDIFRR